jgi:hypothetical protein
MRKLFSISESEKKRFLSLSEQEKRDIYFSAFGKQFDSPERKIPPLPIDIAVRVAVRQLQF